MMEGIEVLNEIKDVCIPTWCIVTIIIFLLIMILIGKFKKIETIRGVAVYFISLLVGFICILLTCCILGKNNIYYRYEVTIDENVNKEEFSDKYKIIDKRGKIYVIEEKQKSDWW